MSWLIIYIRKILRPLDRFFFEKIDSNCKGNSSIGSGKLRYIPIIFDYYNFTNLLFGQKSDYHKGTKKRVLALQIVSKIG